MHRGLFRLLPKAEHDAEARQAAMEALLVVKQNGPTAGVDLRVSDCSQVGPANVKNGVLADNRSQQGRRTGGLAINVLCIAPE